MNDLAVQHCRELLRSIGFEIEALEKIIKSHEENNSPRDEVDPIKDRLGVVQNLVEAINDYITT